MRKQTMCRRLAALDRPGGMRVVRTSAALGDEVQLDSAASASGAIIGIDVDIFMGQI